MHGQAPIRRRPPFGSRVAAARVTVLATLAAALSACSSVGVLNAIEPKGGMTISRDIAYMPGPRGGLDVYRPNRANGSASVVVFVYGGGWDSGAKADYTFVGAALASKGYVTVVPDYRVYPQVRWPSFLQDTARAVAWAKAHAAAYGGDPHRLFLMGHSAGAYNVVALAVDKRWLAAVGMEPRRDLAGVVGLAGPYDFLPLHTDELKTIFGPPEGRPDTQPINHVDGRNPPLFLATDTADKVVDPGNTTRMADKVRAAGGPVQTRDYRGLSHALLVGAIAAPLRFLAPVLADTARFIDAQPSTPAQEPQP